MTVCSCNEMAGCCRNSDLTPATTSSHKEPMLAINAWLTSVDSPAELSLDLLCPPRRCLSDAADAESFSGTAAAVAVADATSLGAATARSEAVCTASMSAAARASAEAFREVSDLVGRASKECPRWRVADSTFSLWSSGRWGTLCLLPCCSASCLAAENSGSQAAGARVNMDVQSWVESKDEASSADWTF